MLTLGLGACPAQLTTSAGVVHPNYTILSGATGSNAVVPPMSLLGVMSMPKGESKVDFDFASLLGPLFFTWVVQLLFPN